MAEPWSVEPAFPELPEGREGARIREVAGVRAWSVMARAGRAPDVVERARTAYGVDLADAPRRSASGDIAFLGVGPGKWLLLASAAIEPSDFAGIASVADQHGGYGILEVTGAAAAAAIGRALPIDLSPEAFPPGSVATTILDHIGVIVCALPGETATFQILVARSLAASFAASLARVVGATP
jgi:sarcosine oxidase subunit gamma